MSVTHRLASAFIPTRVAVVGASDREGSRGRAVWSGVMNSRRVLEAYPVNPKYKYIGLTPCWAGLRDLHIRRSSVSSPHPLRALSLCSKTVPRSALPTCL